MWAVFSIQSCCLELWMFGSHLHWTFTSFILLLWHIGSTRGEAPSQQYCPNQWLFCRHLQCWLCWTGFGVAVVLSSPLLLVLVVVCFCFVFFCCLILWSATYCYILICICSMSTTSSCPSCWRHYPPCGSLWFLLLLYVQFIQLSGRPVAVLIAFLLE